MSTDWVQVVVATLPIGVGGLLFLKADLVTEHMRSGSEAWRQSKAATRAMTPTIARVVGVGFVIVGLIGALMGLFFADKMN